uniref:Uncharacterized protein n=1 Tax=Arundo donax TaxID=35708 RepID=A0A0A9EHI8_ARUDO
MTMDPCDDRLDRTDICKFTSQSTEEIVGTNAEGCRHNQRIKSSKENNNFSTLYLHRTSLVHSN